MTHQQNINYKLIGLMALATGIVIASNYYSQPLLEAIATSFSLSHTSAGFIVTIAQIGYGIGLLFLVPLGDMFERRRLIIVMTLLTAFGLFITAFSQSFWQILIGTLLTGLFSIVAQLLIPFAAAIAPHHQKGKTVGIMIGGLLLGILSARTVAGLLAEFNGWRTIFWFAGILLLILASVLLKALPISYPENKLSYLKTILSVFQLIKSEPILRLRALLGMLTFTNFGLFWTSVTFLLSASPFNYSEGVIGLFGLAGIVGALIATNVGHYVDKGQAKSVTKIGLAFLLLSWLPMVFVQYSIYGLIVGIILLDLAVQGLNVINQSTIYKILPEARNRLTSAYMTSCCSGTAIGSVIAIYTYKYHGWLGIVISGLIICIMNLAIWFYMHKHETKEFHSK
ncbi:permease [Xenorhabdus thuongxuanensis]|uniref:Permease n=2 Tax=Xenorhabdus thuongxuanensis TaxID=1873484 RepID=A0A1Q5TVP2_9GAMM|nr:MFS transporter [Xenorhabdus thuongxuanensis]OKP04260.1 permease [Xenorhabdus thuongxuanensis]